MILELHSHSHFSDDSLSDPAAIVRRAINCGLKAIAITDHNTIAGACAAAVANDDPNFTVIIGSEILTNIGDIIGLFLTREITSRAYAEVIDEIHAQGGIAVLPHPYKGHTLNDDLLNRIDLVEVFNGRIDILANDKGYELARKHGKKMVVGSDAHLLREIGNCRVFLPENTDLKETLLKYQGELKTSQSPPCFVELSQIIKVVKRRKFRQLPKRILALLIKLILPKRSFRRPTANY